MIQYCRPTRRKASVLHDRGRPTIIERSNSANASNVWNTVLPAGVAVSLPVVAV